MGNIAEHAPEEQTVRQYRFLLRTAPGDALQAAHEEALACLTEDDRLRVLTAVRDGLVAGQRLGPGDTSAIARLVSIGERRNPRGFLDACDPPTLLALADAVNQAEAVFGLFAGYATWDGVEPEPTDVGQGVDHGGDPQPNASDARNAEAKAYATAHTMSVTTWAGGA